MQIMLNLVVKVKLDLKITAIEARPLILYRIILYPKKINCPTYDCIDCACRFIIKRLY